MSKRRQPGYHREYRARKRAEDPDFNLKNTLSSLYGLTIGQYRAMLEEQGGVCAACGDPPPPGKRLCVDHDHTTSWIRGLLCQTCNTALGCVRDDTQRLYGLIDYLGAASRTHIAALEHELQRETQRRRRADAREARRQKQRVLSFADQDEERKRG